MDHSHERPMNSRQPSRRSASIPPPGARGGMWLTSRKERRAPAIANAAASIASTQPGPTAATSAPPRAAPPSDAPCIAIRKTANAR